MKIKLLLIFGVICLALFAIGCTPEQQAEADDYVADLEEQVEQATEDLQDTIEEGIEEANADDSVLDEAAAAAADPTQSGDCVIARYPGSVEQVLNSAPMIEQGSYDTPDDVATVQSWFDSNMVDPWFVELEWNRGSKRWVTGDFDVQNQVGCSAMVDVEENQQGTTTIGTVLMDFS